MVVVGAINVKWSSSVVSSTNRSRGFALLAMVLGRRSAISSKFLVRPRRIEVEMEMEMEMEGWLVQQPHSSELYWRPLALKGVGAADLPLLVGLGEGGGAGSLLGLKNGC